CPGGGMLVLKGRRRGGDLLAFAPGGRALAARSETGLQLWSDLSAGAKPTIFRDLDSVGYMRFSPDGARLYLDGWSCGVLDLATREFTRFPEEDGYRFLALTHDGESLVVVNLP